MSQDGQGTGPRQTGSVIILSKTWKWAQIQRKSVSFLVQMAAGRQSGHMLR